MNSQHDLRIIQNYGDLPINLKNKLQNPMSANTYPLPNQKVVETTLRLLLPSHAN